MRRNSVGAETGGWRASANGRPHGLVQRGNFWITDPMADPELLLLYGHSRWFGMVRHKAFSRGSDTGSSKS